MQISKTSSRRVALRLVVRREGRCVESVEITDSYHCWKEIVPSRPPDKQDLVDGKPEQLWVIAKDRRRPFGSHAVKKVEEYNRRNGGRHNASELNSFFGIVGIGSRWANDTSAEWCLSLGEREFFPGSVV